MDDHFPPSSKEEVEKTYQMVLERAGLQKKAPAHRKIRRLPLVAAAAAIVLCMFAGFRAKLAMPELVGGLFSQGNASESSSMNQKWPLLESAGVVLYQSTAANGLTVTVRGAIGDSSLFYLALDVRDDAGSVFTPDVADRLVNTRFEQAYLSFDSEDGAKGVGAYCDMTFLQYDADSHTARFALQGRLPSPEALSSKQVSLSLQNLRILSNEGGNDLEMTGDLHSFFTQIGTTQSLDPQTYFIKQDDPEKRAQNNRFYYTTRGVPFSNLDSTAKLTHINVGSKGTLITLCNTSEGKNDFFEDMALKNVTSGAILPLTSCRQSHSSVELYDGLEERIPANTGLAILYIQEITAPQQLKDYVLVNHSGATFKTIASGEWKLDFALGYPDTTAVYPVKGTVTLSQDTLKVNQIRISPISMTIEAQSSVLTPTDGFAVTLQLKNGSVVELQNSGYSATEDGSLQIHYTLPEIINPEEVTSILADGRELLQ